MTIYDSVSRDTPGFAMFPKMSQLAKCAFSWGNPVVNMSFRHGKRDDVRANLNSFLASVHLPPLHAAVTMEAQNKDAIAILDECELTECDNPADGHFVACDAMIWRRKDIFVIVKPADCIVTMMVALTDSGPIFAVVHSGFRGVDLGLPARVIRRIGEIYGAAAMQIQIAIAPHISQHSYFIRSLEELTCQQQWSGFTLDVDGKHYLNTRGLLLAQLASAGVDPDCIEIYDVDTFAAAARGESFSERYYRLHPHVKIGRFAIAFGARGNE